MAIQNDALIGILLDEDNALTVEELSSACHVHVEWVIELVDEGILEPSGNEVAHWRFAGASLRRARTVRRLQQDLRINLAGAALALELMDEIDDLRAHMRVLGHAD